MEETKEGGASGAAAETLAAGGASLKERIAAMRARLPLLLKQPKFLMIVGGGLLATILLVGGIGFWLSAGSAKKAAKAKEVAAAKASKAEAEKREKAEKAEKAEPSVDVAEIMRAHQAILAGASGNEPGGGRERDGDKPSAPLPQPATAPPERKIVERQGDKAAEKPGDKPGDKVGDKLAGRTAAENPPPAGAEKRTAAALERSVPKSVDKAPEKVVPPAVDKSPAKKPDTRDAKKQESAEAPPSAEKSAIPPPRPSVANTPDPSEAQPSRSAAPEKPAAARSRGADANAAGACTLDAKSAGAGFGQNLGRCLEEFNRMEGRR